jgi:IS5 family transposase
MLRELLGVESTAFSDDVIEFSYQNILDNMELLSEDLLKEINEVIVNFGHKNVFKKKVEEVSILKTNSYVIETNVHFPTDYNLLYDCCRKTLDFIGKFDVKYTQIEGWRKIKNWRSEFKNSCRRIGQIASKGGKNKEENLKKETEFYTKKAHLLVEKAQESMKTFPILTHSDVKNYYELEKYIKFTIKHIDLVERRVLKGETIPHEEKMFSIFETHTEWINKGKPSVELGKKLCITSDQFHLILHHKIMENITDSEVVIEIADKILPKFSTKIWSFDKAFFSKSNKELLQLEVTQVVMPKKGKTNLTEKAEEKTPIFLKYRKKHSAVESNINELKNRGLDKCPDKGYAHFKR